MKAILVEDELLIAKVLANNLESLGYDVLGIATSGTEAIELTQAHRPDYVFMDIFLNGEMDGIDAYRSIKEISPSTKVIYITANNDPYYITKAKESGYLAFLTKPIEKMTLQKVLSYQ